MGIRLSRAGAGRGGEHRALAGGGGHGNAGGAAGVADERRDATPPEAWVEALLRSDDVHIPVTWGADDGQSSVGKA